MNKGQLVTRYIKHLAESANFKCGTFNKLCNGLIENRFKLPNVSYTHPLPVILKEQKLNTFTKHIILTVLVFWGLNVTGQELSNPKKINTKGEYIQKQTGFIFPENFDSYQRKDVYSFDKKKTNIGVVYGNQQNKTTISIYVYPAGDGYEGWITRSMLTPRNG